MNHPDFEPLLRDIAQEWNKAEKVIKIAEQIDGDVVNPAIYELRYAGRRIIEALSCDDDHIDKALKLLADAKFDCHRAQHDAIDAATSKMVGDLSVAADKLGAKTILDYFPEFPSLSQSLFDIREKIAISRDDRDNRDAIYDTIAATDLTTLTSIFYRFRSSESLMIQAAVQDRKAIRRNNIFGYGGLLIGALAIFVTILVFSLS